MEALMEFIKGTGGVLLAGGVIVVFGLIALVVKCYRKVQQGRGAGEDGPGGDPGFVYREACDPGVTPGGGHGYFGEADRDRPDWQERFDL